VSEAIEVAIRRRQEPDRIRANAAAMRERMDRDLRPFGPWDMKLRAGGLIDIEFIAQTLQLVRLQEAGFQRSPTTHIALERLSRTGAIARADAALLIEAERLWRTIQGMLRLTVGRPETAALPAASALPLLQAAAKAGVSAVDTGDLLHKSENIAKQVRTMFERYVIRLRILRCPRRVGGR
jgi:glutamate-ammonia-ligase adenylyltransferase